MTPAAGDAPDSARAERATALVRAWLAESEQIRTEPAARRLAAVLADPSGLDFTVGFVDGVIRPEDPRVEAYLALLSRSDVEPAGVAADSSTPPAPRESDAPAPKKKKKK